MDLAKINKHYDLRLLMNGAYRVISEDFIDEVKSLGIRKIGRFNLSGGEKSDVYFDVKKLYGDGEVLCLMAKTMWHPIYDDSDGEVTHVAGMGYGALPLVSAISAINNTYLTLVRDGKKDHGIQNILEGHIPDSESHVAIVDDVFTTGSSLRKVIGALEPTGANIFGCYVVIKREEGELSVPLKYLLEPKDLI